MHIECHGCGIDFEAGHRRRYCCDVCRYFTKFARSGTCHGCDATSATREAGPFTYESFEHKAAVQALDAEFAAAHAPCRRRYLDEHGRSGVVARPSSPSRARSSSYRRHFAAVTQRARGACQICGLLVDVNAGPDDDLAPQLDLVETAWEGGSDDLDNLRLAHRWCNLARNDPMLRGVDEVIAEKARARFSRQLD